MDTDPEAPRAKAFIAISAAATQTDTVVIWRGLSALDAALGAGGTASVMPAVVADRLQVAKDRTVADRC
jgi:hypothetical protein